MTLITMTMYHSIITLDLKSIEATTFTFKMEVKGKMMSTQTTVRKRQGIYSSAGKGFKPLMMNYKTS
jgi:hypothetical protein